MIRAKWQTAGVLAGVLVSLAGARAGFAQAPAPATRPAPFIKPLPEPAEPPATKPAEAPYIAPITQPGVSPTTKPAPGPFIKPIPVPDTRPATIPSTAPTSQPTTKTASQPVMKPIEVGQKTVGFSPWVPVERGWQCMDLSLMPADVREMWVKHCTTKGRILAERAGRAAALKKLARRVGEMAIAPGMTVGQFLATTDQPDVGAEMFLRGATVRATRYHAEKLVVELELEVRSRTVLASLKSWARGHVKGDRAGLRHIETALLKAKNEVLRERGLAAAPVGEVLNATGALLRATKAATQPATIPAGAASEPKTAPATSLLTTG